MKIQSLLIVLIGLVLIFCSSCDLDVVGNGYGNQRIFIGDSTEFKSLDYDDTHWKPYLDDLHGEIYWVRFNIEISDTIDYLDNPGIKVVSMGSYEAFWDGEPIGKSGVIAEGDRQEEVGAYWNFFSLEKSMVEPGPHVLSLRSTISDEHLYQHAYFILSDYYNLTRLPLQIVKYMFLVGGGIIIASLYFLFLFIAQRKDYASLLLSIICIVVLAIFILEYLKLFYPYPYTFQRVRLQFIGYFHLLLSFIVPLLFCLIFRFPYKRYLFLVLAIVIAILEYKYHTSFDFIAKKHNTIMWIFSFSIVLYALYERQKSAIIVLIGCLLSVLMLKLSAYFNIPFVSAYDIGLFLSFMVLILAIIFTIAVKRKEERIEYEASLVLSERLKSELLKKNIKPHFIMNTLTSLIDWVEESPKEGVKFINALASEFEVLNEMADLQQVPISKELRLCQTHLDVMAFRKEINYYLEEKNIDYKEEIPPAVFHTIIENGISHGIPDENANMKFFIEYEKTAKYKVYKVLCQSKFQKNTLGFKEVKEGTGMKYIKSRLQESYPNKWKFESSAQENGWLTVIKIQYT